MNEGNMMNLNWNFFDTQYSEASDSDEPFSSSS